ncbi:MAG: hypothetical protein IJS90_01490, partial [Clostridia bacterium]|nr:hypothetical protein [Clostridia bacterium]
LYNNMPFSSIGRSLAARCAALPVFHLFLFFDLRRQPLQCQAQLPSFFFYLFSFFIPGASRFS